MELRNLELEAIKALKNVDSINDLNNFRAMYLGKKSKLQEIMRQMKDLSVEERKELGKKSNVFKNKITNLIEEKKLEIEQREVKKKLESEAIDVTLPGK